MLRIHPPLGGHVRTREAKQVANLLVRRESANLVGDNPFAEIEALGEDFEPETCLFIGALGLMKLLPGFFDAREVVGVIRQLRAVEPDGMAADIIVQAVAPTEVHFQIRQLGNMIDGLDKLAPLGLEWVHAEFVVHQQT